MDKKSDHKSKEYQEHRSLMTPFSFLLWIMVGVVTGAIIIIGWFTTSLILTQDASNIAGFDVLFLSLLAAAVVGGIGGLFLLLLTWFLELVTRRSIANRPWLLSLLAGTMVSTFFRSFIGTDWEIGLSCVLVSVIVAAIFSRWWDKR